MTSWHKRHHPNRNKYDCKKFSSFMIEVNDPSLKSFIEVDVKSHFPIQNLPYCVFHTTANPSDRIGVAIGDYILDLSRIENEGLFDGPKLVGTSIFSKSSLNEFMAMGQDAWREARTRISYLLRDSTPDLRDNTSLRNDALVDVYQCTFSIPFHVAEFTDFYSSKFHAFNVGSMIRGPDNAMMPNWVHLPVAYHGRASSVIVSGTDIIRPNGQTQSPDQDEPVFGPSKRLDYELELGYVIGTGNELGQPIPIDEVAEHIFGMVIVNDWSARDIQVWEYRPLGPFLGKNFATSISPFVIPFDALEPFTTSPVSQDPVPLPYLQSEQNWTFDIHLEVFLHTDNSETTLTRSNARYLYWNIAQQVAHHSISGCNMRTGDLLGTGTISGPEHHSRGCLLELSELGRKPISLSDGSERTFLEDGDSVTMTGWCQGDGYRVGFGSVTTRVLPARY
jgi:fumarylacetoacetase